MKRVLRPLRRQAAPTPEDGGTATAGGRRDRRRRKGGVWRKGRRLGQAALFAAVRGVAYALGTAAGAYLLYWLSQL